MVRAFMRFPDPSDQGSKAPSPLRDIIPCRRSRLLRQLLCGYFSRSLLSTYHGEGRRNSIGQEMPRKCACRSGARETATANHRFREDLGSALVLTPYRSTAVPHRGRHQVTQRTRSDEPTAANHLRASASSRGDSGNAASSFLLYRARTVRSRLGFPGTAGILLNPLCIRSLLTLHYLITLQGLIAHLRDHLYQESPASQSPRVHESMSPSKTCRL
ncbi:hypothetical protein F4780DRAFT_289258 [Xylariomycetidae sp. FL0641]|nr:hypothetical protein F4780DRAFT_289258 [Xylariomycetidae sp. FL0641]